MTKAILFALCFGLAASVVSANWIVASGSFNRREVDFQSLVKVVDVRGVFGKFKTVLISGDNSTVEHLSHSNFFEHVYMVPEAVLPSRINPQQSLFLALEMMNDQARPTILSLVEKFEHFEFQDIVFVIVPADAFPEWPSGVQEIRIARRPIRLAGSFEQNPASKYFNRITYNDLIAEQVARVDKDELYATDDYLSNQFFTRQSQSSEILLAADYLSGRLRSFGLSVSTQNYRLDYAPNIIAELRGVEQPEKIVVVGAHYDSRATSAGSTVQRAPGADDNGSGSSALIELARILSSSNLTYSFTIQFLLFSGEEQGLYGSEAYANFLVDQGTEVVAMFNMDMLGYRIPNRGIEMGMKDRSITLWLLELSFQITAMYVPELPVALSSSCCSDYLSFYEAGFPAIGYFENPTSASNYPSYHTSTDVIGNLDFDQIKLESSAVLAAVMTFAVPIAK